MKLLAVQNARSIWLGRLSDLNPRGINLFPVIAPVLQETYKFVKYPTAQEIANAKDWKFEAGEFADSEGYPVKIEFTIYNDGFVVDSGLSTEHADAFLHDVLTKFDETFKFLRYTEVIKQKRYVSELHMTTSKPFDLINPQLKIISEFFQAMLDQIIVLSWVGYLFSQIK
jgi:hypothetical protein